MNDKDKMYILNDILGEVKPLYLRQRVGARFIEYVEYNENTAPIVLPCKIGDKVYRNDGVWRVVGFKCIRSYGWRVILERWQDRFLDYHETTNVLFSSFGKTVFLSKVEAEAKFRVLKGE